MKAKIHYVNSPEEECAVLYVYKSHPEIKKLQELIENEAYKSIPLPCFLGEEKYYISCEQILFIETIHEKSFVHTRSKMYESKKRLYELEKILPEQFARISKSAIMNLNRVEHYNPLANGLMKAVFFNGEETYISRKYLRLLRAKIGGKNS